MPAYANVYDVLKREIMEGEFAIGELLPPEPELEKRFDVSRTTIRRATEMLARDGFVQAKQGRGTQILDYKTRQNLNRVTSISETLRNKGFVVRAKSIHIDLIPATGHIMEELGLTSGDYVARAQRIQLADEVPIAIMKNYIPAVKVPGIENYADQITSLYKFMEDRYNLYIDSAHDRISARTADFSEAEMLQVPIGSAILFMRRVCHSNGQPICADRLSILGSKYELGINMAGRGESDF